MAYPKYLRDRARWMRTEKRLSLDEIAERLALPKTTVWYWISDLPLTRPRRENWAVGNRRMQRKYRLLREAAYNQGWHEYDELLLEPTFRDFVVLYVAEGYKRNRNSVALGNSDDNVIAVAAAWIRRFATNPVTYSVQYHADQDVSVLQDHWGTVLGVDGSNITLQRKSNSGKLATRIWRCEFGVLTVRACDTAFRARLQAWIDRVRGDWALHFTDHPGA